MRLQCIGLVALVVVMTSMCVGQNVTGDLEGWIADSTDTPIAGVSVVVTGPSLQGTRSTSSDESGYYRILALPVGWYTVTLTHVSFTTTEIKNVRISLGEAMVLQKSTMFVREVELPEVTIVAAQPSIGAPSAAEGSHLGIETIRQLPVERSYQSVPLLLPHVTMSYHGDGANYSGATGAENRYFVNGVEVTSSYDGFSSTNLPYNFIKELYIQTGGYEAEYKSSLGGILNVVTPSGGNDVHGQVFGFLTKSSLSEAERTTHGVAPSGSYTQYDVGVSIGGPVAKDQLWYYVAYNPNVDREIVPVGGQADQEDKTTTHMFAGNLQWRINERHSLGLTVFGDPQVRRGVGAETMFGTGVWDSIANLDAWLSNIRTGGVSAMVKGNHIFSDNVLLESSVSYGRKIHKFLPISATGDGLAFFDNIIGTASGGLLERSDYTLDDGSIALKATYILGPHTLKAGAEIQQSILDNHYAVNRLQRLSDSLYYRSDWQWGGVIRSRMPSFFLQDSWRPFSGLTLNPGLRWEAQYIYGPSGHVTQKILNMWQPRIGIVVQPWEDGKDKLYASYGRFYQPLYLYLSFAYNIEKSVFTEALFYNDPRIDPSSFILGLSGLYYVNSPDLRGQSYDEFTVGYERLLFSDVKINVRGIYRPLLEAINDFMDPNLGTAMYGNMGRYPMDMWPRPQRDYTALELTVERSSSTGLNLTASYVLSRNYGNYNGMVNADRGFSPMPNSNSQYFITSLIPRSTGVLPNDRTHVFKIAAAQQLWNGVNLGVFFSWMSGSPLSEYGKDTSGLPIFLSDRGTAGRTPSLWDVNARLTYDVSSLFSTLPHLRLIVDMLHIGSQRTAVLYDQEHYLGVSDNEGNQTDPNPYYGQPIAFQPPMSVRLGIEMDF